MFIVTFVILIFASFTSGALVTWSPNKSFNLPNNFKDKILPCSKKTVVFPEYIQESVLFAGRTISVSELILPINGEISFADSTSVVFGADPKDVNCTSEGYSFYKDDTVSSWETPGVWTSSRFNKATPDAERVPCYDDDVVFPTTSQFTILLPDLTQYVNGLSVDGRYMTTTKFLERIFNQRNGAQQFVVGQGLISYPVAVQNEKCKSTAGCPCQTNGLRIDCTLKYCPAPKCSNPIKPIGHCCEICGGSLLFEIENFNMQAFKKIVKTVINSYGADTLVYHLGLLPTVEPGTLKTLPKRVQLIVMNKYEYTGASSEAINEISYQLNKEWIKNDKVMLLSGSPPSKYGMGGQISLSVLVIVILAIGIVFVYYYRNTSVSELRNSLNGRGSLLSRFQRRSDSVVSLTRRDSAVSGLRGTTASSSFRNPLYDSRRGRVIMTESTLEE